MAGSFGGLAERCSSLAEQLDGLAESYGQLAELSDGLVELRGSLAEGSGGLAEQFRQLAELFCQACKPRKHAKSGKKSRFAIKRPPAVVGRQKVTVGERSFCEHRRRLLLARPFPVGGAVEAEKIVIARAFELLEAQHFRIREVMCRKAEYHKTEYALEYKPI